MPQLPSNPVAVSAPRIRPRGLRVVPADVAGAIQERWSTAAHGVACRRLEPGPELVPRPRLVRRLSETAAPLVILQAPAGYGKTTLLAEWAAADERAFAWIGLGGAGDDPAELLGGLARQLDPPRRRRVLVLDDPQVLTDPAALALVADVAGRQGPGSSIAIATRHLPALPLGRLRVQGAVLELAAAELALTEQEAAELLDNAGLTLGPTELATLYERSEGWPAGLRLAALALREQPDVAAAAARFDGADRFVADYLRDTLLATLEPAEVAFLRHSAPLGELSGPLCDAALERRGSAALLRRLARSNVLLTALDRGERRFRVHPLLASMLVAELRRSEPELEPPLHRRASDWYAQQGDVPRALDHALAAGDAARAGELLWSVAPAYASGGRNRQLGAWLEQLDDARIGERPALALTAAVRQLTAGDRDAAERWAEAAERGLEAAAELPAPELLAGLAVLRAGLARGDARQLVADAEHAHELAGSGVWRSAACLLQGVAQRLLGAPDGARTWLELASRQGAVPTPIVRAQALALLALLELEQDDWEAARALAESALHGFEDGLGDEPACALVYAVAACARAHVGQVEQARQDADRSQQLLAGLPDPAPWYAAETEIALARALLRLSDAADARSLLTTAGRTLRRLPDAPGLQAWLDEAWERADSFAIGAVVGPAVLTIAELRVLRFLPSHLSFREIAGRLHVSANTVKTQAHAVYRKLDASSRSEAVARASLIGLIDG
jgi:LuxR family maltose regulon positive regulatory protein